MTNFQDRFDDGVFSPLEVVLDCAETCAVIKPAQWLQDAVKCCNLRRRSRCKAQHELNQSDRDERSVARKHEDRQWFRAVQCSVNPAEWTAILENIRNNFKLQKPICVFAATDYHHFGEERSKCIRDILDHRPTPERKQRFFRSHPCALTAREDGTQDVCPRAHFCLRVDRSGFTMSSIQLIAAMAGGKPMVGIASRAT